MVTFDEHGGATAMTMADSHRTEYPGQPAYSDPATLDRLYGVLVDLDLLDVMAPEFNGVDLGDARGGGAFDRDRDGGSVIGLRLREPVA